MIDVDLPHNGWRPRDYQKNLWHYLEYGGKRAIEIAHRRWGKDDVALHWACIAAHQKVATYWHMLPEYAQARKAIWNAINPHTGVRRIDEAFPHELRASTNEQEMLIKLKVGSTWQVVGSDSYNSLVGTPPYGLVVSEWALADPAAWAYLAPILEENGGWAVFITTPRGKNHAHGMLKMAKKDPAWFAEVQGVDETGFPLERVESARREYHGIFGIDAGDALIEQEYYCSFEAAVLGAVYGKQMKRAEKDKRITSVKYDKDLPVYTAWDLGRADAMVAIFYQLAAGEIRVIDYHEQTGMDVLDMAELLYGRKIHIQERDALSGKITRYKLGPTLTRRSDYNYERHWLPHDGAYKLLAANGRSIYQQLTEDFGIKNISVQPAATQENCIAAARSALDLTWIDEDLERFLEVMRQYQFEWDDTKKKFRDRPLHNWASHGAKAYDLLARTWRMKPDEPEKQEPQFMASTFNDLLEQSKRKRIAREE